MATTSPYYLTLLLLVVMATVPGILGVDDEEEEDMTNGDIRKNLDMLTNEVKRLKSLKHLSATSANQEFFKLIFAKRSKLADGKVKFTVRFSSNTNNRVVFIWRSYNHYMYDRISEVVDNQIHDLDRGVYESSTIVPASTYNRSHLLFMFADKKKGAHLFLRHPLGGEDVTQTQVEMPVFKVDPPGDLVYEPGQNITIKVTYPNERRPGPGSDFDSAVVKTHWLLIKPGDKKFTTNYNIDLERFFRPNSQLHYLDETMMASDLSTGVVPYTGLITVTTGLYHPEGLIGRAELLSDAILRPSTQSGPFPDGSLYINPHNWDSEAIVNGERIMFCTYGEECRLYCDVVGSDITSLTLYKTVNGRTINVDVDILGANLGVSYRKMAEYMFTPQRGDPSPTRYSCLVTNAQGRSKIASYVYTFGVAVEFRLNDTYMEPLGNDRVDVVCTARGEPQPNVTITCNDFTITDPEVLFDNGDFIKVKATCDDIREYSYVECTAKTEHQTELHYFETHELP